MKVYLECKLLTEVPKCFSRT